MKKVVVSGKTVDDAALIGAKELKLPLEQVDVKVLDEGSKGLLPRGRARVLTSR